MKGRKGKKPGGEGRGDIGKGTERGERCLGEKGKGAKQRKGKGVERRERRRMGGDRR